jgi:two-component sensor histidine kinase
LSLPLRVRLPVLVAGTMLPLILFAGALVYRHYQTDRQAAFDAVLNSVRGMRLVLDREMYAVTSALRVLAQSRSLRNNDLDAFRGNLTAFVEQYPGSSIALVERDGAQLLTIGASTGAPLLNLNSIEDAFVTGDPVYSNLSALSRQVGVLVPVRRGGRVVAALAFSPSPASLQSIIQQRPTADWTVSIFDRTGTSIARVPNPGQTVGQRASPTLYAELFKAPEATLVTTSLEGVELITAFTRSPTTGWTVAAGLPTASLTRPLLGALGVTAAAGAVLLAIGLAFAIGMARSIARGEVLHELLLAEVNHRVKNTLATVQSIALQTFRNTPDPVEARRKFDARLVALGKAHDVLSERKWERAAVGDVVRRVLEPYLVDRADRVQLSGGEVLLSPRSALMLSMIVHELATNATKYGALSDEHGRVAVSWAESGHGHVSFEWRETGGPAVTERTRKGFGSTLIEQAFRHQLGGSAEVSFEAAGLVCRLGWSQD